VSVTNGSDELWVGVKCQSKAEIAGSPRNALRCSPREFRLNEVEHCCCAGASPPTKRRQTPNAFNQCPRSETVGANVHCQKGNNPDLQLRPLNEC
jgi:hypothetical protein